MSSSHACFIPERLPQEPPLAQQGDREGDTLRVVELDLNADRRYHMFVASHPKASIYHHPGWLNSLTAEYDTGSVVLGCENGIQQLEGVLPLFSTRGIPLNVGVQQTGRRLSSLPRTPLAGPLFTSDRAAKLLLRAAGDRARMESLQLQIKTGDYFSPAMCEGLVTTDWRPTYVLEVPQRREDLRFGDARNRHNIKWAVKKAEQNGISVRTAENESELIAWYPLYLQVMRRNCVPPRSPRLFAAMWRYLASQGLMRLLIAEQKQGMRTRLVSGSIFLTFGETTFYAFTGIADRDLSSHANDLVLWRAINDACGTSVRRFDFGEVTEDHPELARFKTKWGALPEKQYRYYSGEPSTEHEHSSVWRNNAMKLISRIWQRLPLGMTQQIGDLVYSRL